MEAIANMKATVPRKLKVRFCTLLASKDETFVTWLREHMTAYIEQDSRRKALEHLCEGDAHAETSARAS